MNKLVMSPTLCVALAIALFAGDNTKTDADRQAILGLQAQAQQAHLTGNAALLASRMADKIVLVQNGVVQQTTREEVQSHFAQYFAEVRYSEWEDVAPPEVHISADGKTAWGIFQIKAALTHNNGDPPEAFVSSWIATYTKGASGWQQVAISSGCDPACGTPKKSP